MIRVGIIGWGVKMEMEPICIGKKEEVGWAQDDRWLYFIKIMHGIPKDMKLVF